MRTRLKLPTARRLLIKRSPTDGKADPRMNAPDAKLLASSDLASVEPRLGRHGTFRFGFCSRIRGSSKPWLDEGFKRAGGGKSLRNFAIQASAHVEVSDDVKGALDRLKPEVALYVGGMGHRNKNFHKDIMVRRGYKAEAERIQELFLSHRKDEAAAAVPDEWVDAKSLVGPPERIKQRFRAWEESGITGLTVRSRQPEAIEVMAAAAGLTTDYRRRA